MASTVYIADITTQTSPKKTTDVEMIGVFTTMAKAIAACKYHHLYEQSLKGVNIDIALENFHILSQSKSYAMIPIKGAVSPIVTYTVAKARVR